MKKNENVSFERVENIIDEILDQRILNILNRIGFFLLIMFCFAIICALFYQIGVDSVIN